MVFMHTWSSDLQCHRLLGIGLQNLLIAHHTVDAKTTEGSKNLNNGTNFFP